jgi:hypothetical protein
MGEGPDRVNGSGSTEVVAREIDGIRGDIGRLVDELDRRRHEALDVSLQIRRHPAVAAAVVATAAFAIGALIAVAVRRRRRSARVSTRARNLRQALSRMARHPEEFGREPGIGEKLLVAAGTAAASLLVRRALDRSMRGGAR